MKENLHFRLCNQEGLWKKKVLKKARSKHTRKEPIYHEARYWNHNTALNPMCRFFTYLTFMKSECVLQSTGLELLRTSSPPDNGLYTWELHCFYWCYEWMDCKPLKNHFRKEYVSWLTVKSKKYATMKTCIKDLSGFGVNCIDSSERMFMKWCITNTFDSSEEIS